jgi:hypothetical protein
VRERTPFAVTGSRQIHGHVYGSHEQPDVSGHEYILVNTGLLQEKQKAEHPRPICLPRYVVILRAIRSLQMSRLLFSLGFFPFLLLIKAQRPSSITTLADA